MEDERAVKTAALNLKHFAKYDDMVTAGVPCKGLAIETGGAIGEQRRAVIRTSDVQPCKLVMPGFGKAFGEICLIIMQDVDSEMLSRLEYRERAGRQSQ